MNEFSAFIVEVSALMKRSDLDANVQLQVLSFLLDCMIYIDLVAEDNPVIQSILVLLAQIQDNGEFSSDNRQRGPIYEELVERWAIF